MSQPNNPSASIGTLLGTICKMHSRPCKLALILPKMLPESTQCDGANVLTEFSIERMWFACSPKFPPAPPQFFQKCEIHNICYID
ncbi:unnamed protein product [Trichogramma brassicae]|uniref:Uncharacterized protein n=1 Tax=Trichogramma brassicae TaxID=86971 RepID=A0A6H5I4Q6_9HYME|nr:unnamed protein product [Trichogramma brassicae]